MTDALNTEIPEELVDLMDEENGHKRENFRKNTVTKIAYLIGVSENHLTDPGKFTPDELEALKNNEAATIIRHLCILRTLFFKKYSAINKVRYAFQSPESLGEEIIIESIEYLRTREIEVWNVSDKNLNASTNIAYINQYIQDNIDTALEIFPGWIKKKYISLWST